MRDVAERLGVSRSTVSLALRDSPMISEALRERVKVTARELGYQKDPALSALFAHQKNGLNDRPWARIGFVCHASQNQTHLDPEKWAHRAKIRSQTEILDEAAGALGYQVTPYCWDTFSDAQSLWARVEADSVTALVFGLVPESLFEAEVPWERLAAVQWGGGFQRLPVHLVAYDVMAQAEKAVIRMIASGARRIAFLTVPFTGAQALFGARSQEEVIFEQTIRERCLLETLSGRYTQAIEYAGTWSGRPFEEKAAMVDWLQAREVDGVIALNDGFVVALRETGLVIPDELQVIGLHVGDIVQTKVSGFERGREATAQRVVELLDRMIRTNERGRPETTVSILLDTAWREGTTMKLESKEQGAMQ